MHGLGRVCAITLAVIAPAARGGAATFTVNVTADRTDANPADGLCDSDLATAGEQCTLRAAVQQANATPGADTIVLPAGTYKLTIRGSNDENASATGDLDVTDELTLTGAGASSTRIDGRRAKDRIFEILGTATMSGITVQRGRAPGGSTGGGGLRSHGVLTLTDAVVTRCKSVDDAGGIDVRGGHLTLTNVALTHNRAGDDGGAIDVDGGIADLTGVLIQGNRAHDEAGGIECSGAVVNMTDTQVRSNRARTDGGGVVNEEGGTMSLTRCAILGNRAPTGGGLSTADVALGANTTVVRETTIAKNRKTDCAGSLTSLGGNADGDRSCGF